MLSVRVVIIRRVLRLIDCLENFIGRFLVQHRQIALLTFQSRPVYNFYIHGQISHTGPRVQPDRHHHILRTISQRVLQIVINTPTYAVLLLAVVGNLSLILLDHFVEFCGG